MMRIPFIVAGVAAAAVLMGINAYRKRNPLKNITTGELKIDSASNGLPVNVDVMVNTTAVRPGLYSLKDIQPVKRIKLPETLETKYPGFKILETKNADKVAVEI
jgi:hypothetical protein